MHWLLFVVWSSGPRHWHSMVPVVRVVSPSMIEDMKDMRWKQEIFSHTRIPWQVGSGLSLFCYVVIDPLYQAFLLLWNHSINLLYWYTLLLALFSHSLNHSPIVSCLSVVSWLSLIGFGGEGGAGLFGKPPPPPVKHNIRDQNFGPPAGRSGVFNHILFTMLCTAVLCLNLVV